MESHEIQPSRAASAGGGGMLSDNIDQMGDMLDDSDDGGSQPVRKQVAGSKARKVKGKPGLRVNTGRSAMSGSKSTSHLDVPNR